MIVVGPDTHHRCSPSRVIQNHQIATSRIDHVQPDFGAHVRGGRVVPHTVGIGDEVDEGIEGSVGHRTDVDRRRTEGPELPTTEFFHRPTRHRHDRRGPLAFDRHRQPFAVPERTITPDCPPPHISRLMRDQGHDPTVAIDHAQRSREVRNSARRVGGTVEWIDDGHEITVEVLGTALLRHDPESGPTQSREGDVIGQQIGGVLTVASTGRTPVGDLRQCHRHIVGHCMQQLEDSGGLHDDEGSVGTSPGDEEVFVAVIDVAGFVADMKSHAVDHGFHVHDERHFVETYSLRQLWEVDLHPEEACDGPIDLHLSLEVDPRALLGFEDAVAELVPEVDEPPTGFSFPLLFTWALPPLPHPPDLLVLATELAGIGGIDLPLEVSAIDSTVSVTDAPERKLSIVARLEVPLADVYHNDDEVFCGTLDRCRDVSLYLLQVAPSWLGEE